MLINSDNFKEESLHMNYLILPQGWELESLFVEAVDLTRVCHWFSLALSLSKCGIHSLPGTRSSSLDLEISNTVPH